MSRLSVQNEFMEVDSDDGVDQSDQVDEEVIRVLRESIDEGKVFQRIDLSRRHLKFLPEPICKIHGLAHLNLSNNLIQILYNIFGVCCPFLLEVKADTGKKQSVKLTSIQSLRSLSSFRAKTSGDLPDSISGIRKLEELNVSSNLLETLPDSIGLLVNLKLLDVSGNKLIRLPESISGCRSLIELDASFNNLMFLPTNFGYGLVNLQKLSIPLNKVRVLPNSICEMKSLRHLNARFNAIHGLPRGIGRLAHLEILNMSSNFNNFTELPESISNLINLRELDLSNNQIRVLPDTIYQLKNLIELNLDQNPIVVPPIKIVNQGVEPIQDYMMKKRLDMIKAEHERISAEESTEAEAGWIQWGSLVLSRAYNGVSKTVSEYIGGNASDNPFLQEQR